MTQRLTSAFLALCLLVAIPLTVAAEDALWIDVRTAQEFSDGHVTGAVNIPYEEIAGQIEAIAPDKDALIYLYCRSGRRSGIARDTLDGLGYTRAVNVGGLDDALEKAGQNSSN
jgi:phage shock protein E